MTFDERARSIPDYILSADRDEQVATLKDILRTAALSGFGDNCFATAYSINKVLLDGKGENVVAVNRTINARDGKLVGHAAVKFAGVLWDADATPKQFEDIEHWGRLDPEDDDHDLTAEQADDVEILHLSQEDLAAIARSNGKEPLMFESDILNAVTKAFEF